MKINLDIYNGIIISPETEFESEYIAQTFGTSNLRCFVKRGLTPAHIVGIKVCLPDKTSTGTTISASQLIKSHKKGK